MDEQKKQWVMFGVLGALVLGTGSYYFFVRDSEGSDQKAPQRPAPIRKSPAVADNALAERRKNPVVSSTDKRPKVIRKDRNKQNQINKERKRRRNDTRRGKKKEKSLIG